MHREYLQNIRYKLQKRVRRLNSSEPSLYHYILCQYWAFINKHEVFKGIIHNLIDLCPDAKECADKITNSGDPYLGNTEEESAAIAYWVLKYCIDSGNPRVETTIGGYTYQARSGGALDIFHELFVEPFYEYIDEYIDDNRAILSFLIRYKHRCEWFERKRLFELWQSETRKGEKNLAQDLYRYLHDQGMEFFIEPASVSGEADLVSSQVGDDRLIADAKVFKEDRGKSYLIQGFKQIYQYTLDFNEAFGYLVIYNIGESDLRFAVANNEQGVPFVICNNKTIFILTIDLYPHEQSASHRVAGNPVVIEEPELLGEDSEAV